MPILLVMPAVWLVFLPLLDSFSNLLVSILSVLAVLAIRLFVAKQTKIAGPKIVLMNGTFDKTEIASLQTLDKYETRRKIGPDSDARALLHYSSASKYSILVELKPGSKWPYGVISTNRPEQLTQALS